jgi:hypothetical protein
MTRALLAIFVGAMVLCSPALAAPAGNIQAPEDMIIDDMGGTLCSQYLQVRRYDPHLDKNFWNFALGLMGGLNMGRLLSGLDVRDVGSRAGIPGAITLGTLTATMVAYCEQHPQDSYAFGVTWQIFRNRPLVPGSQQDWQRRRGG